MRERACTRAHIPTRNDNLERENDNDRLSYDEKMLEMNMKNPHLDYQVSLNFIM